MKTLKVFASTIIMLQLGFAGLNLKAQNLVSTFYFETRSDRTPADRDKEIHVITDPNAFVLEPCVKYKIVVTGTYNIYNYHAASNSGNCGNHITIPAYQPIFETVPSLGSNCTLPQYQESCNYVQNGWASSNQKNPRFDAQYNFACGVTTGNEQAISRIMVNIDGSLNHGTVVNNIGHNVIPHPVTSMPVTLNSYWTTLSSLSGNTPAFNTNHSYEYEIYGNGHPMAVLQRSSENSDDYGQLKFEIYELSNCNPFASPPIAFSPNANCLTQININRSNYPCANISELNTIIDWGDGTTTNGNEYSHRYSSPGNYQITITQMLLVNGECCSKSSTINYTTPPFTNCEPCELLLNAAIKVQFLSSGAGTESYEFSELSGFGSLPNATIFWNFHDGSGEKKGKKVQHTYTYTGSHVVTMRIFYFDDQTGECCNLEFTRNFTNASGGGGGGDSAPPSGNNEGNSINKPNHQNKNLVKSSANSFQEMDLKRITIHPNPTNGISEVTFNGIDVYTIVVYGSDGRKVNSIKSEDHKKDVKIDLTGETSGVYFVQIISKDGKTVNKKLILK